MPDATLDFATIKNVRADYKRRVVTTAMSKPTVTPLDDGSGWVTAYVAKGAHAEDAMREAVRRHCGYDERDPVEFSYIVTRYYRWIPEPPNSGAGYDQRLERSEPGRGAFIATYVELK